MIIPGRFKVANSLTADEHSHSHNVAHQMDGSLIHYPTWMEPTATATNCLGFSSQLPLTEELSYTRAVVFCFTKQRFEVAQRFSLRSWSLHTFYFYHLTLSYSFTMADPFEVRMRFTSQLQHLNASVASAQKAAQYALRYRDMDEDLHSCILEQLERVVGPSILIVNSSLI